MQCLLRFVVSSLFYACLVLPSSSNPWTYRIPLLKSLGVEPPDFVYLGIFRFILFMTIMIVYLLFLLKLWYAGPNKRLTFEREIRKTRYVFTCRKFLNASHDHRGCRTRCSTISWNRAIANEKKSYNNRAYTLGEAINKTIQFSRICQNRVRVYRVAVERFVYWPSRGWYDEIRHVRTILIKKESFVFEWLFVTPRSEQTHSILTRHVWKKIERKA